MLTCYTATALQPPRPYQAFAVRSEEPRHAWQARAPFACVHRLPTDFLNAAALRSLRALGLARLRVACFGDVDYAAVTTAELAAQAAGVDDLEGGIACALQRTRVLGGDLAAYRARVAARIDFLGCCGAGFHNDVRDHWTACLFWNLTLAAHDIEFVMPHAGIRVPLAPGDLLVFDPSMAHGLCRPHDAGQAVAASFGPGHDEPQVFLSGELPLTDAQWAALGSPWLPVEQHQDRRALELMAAEFDGQSGAVKRPASLARCLLRSTHYADTSPVNGK